MQFKKRVLTLLQVREHEWWLVRQLFFQQFFSGAGIALFFTAAFILFLKKFEITELWKVLVVSACLQWLTGVIYAKLEHVFSIKTLILIINLFATASIIAFRVANFYTDSMYFYFALLVWYNVLYLLNSLDFWGLAAVLFDVRQSKRLFGIISAGDIPAKFIGYISAAVLAPFIGTENMLFAGAAAVLLSLVYWNKLRKSGHLDINLHHDHHHERKPENFTETVYRFFDNKLVLHLAIFSFLISSIATLIYFIFYSKIKLESHNDKLLESYIPLFLALSRGIAIILKLFFTNRITNLLGIRGSLLINPVILLLILAFVFILPEQYEAAKFILLIYGLLSVVNDALRSSILTPVMLSIMQPLRVNARLRAHNIIKGVMDPFGFMFVGLTIYLMMGASHNINLINLSYILALLLVVSIAWIFIVNAEYARMLVVALQNRYINNQEMEIDRQTLSFFYEKSKNCEPNDAIFILNLLGRNPNPEALKIINVTLDHPDDYVKMEAIRTIERMHLIGNTAQMESIATAATNRKLKSEAVKAIYSLTTNVNYSEHFIDADLQLKSSAIAGMLRNEKLTEKGLTHLKEMINSEDALQRKFAVGILSENPKHRYVSEIIRLINDPDLNVSYDAIKNSGRFHLKETAVAILEKIDTKIPEKIIFNALIENGHHSIPAITEYLNKNKLHPALRLKLYNVVGKTGGEQALKLLDHVFDSDKINRNGLVECLQLASFKVSRENEKKYQQLISDLLFEAAKHLVFIRWLNSTGKFQLLAHALELELFIYRDLILNAFTFFYDSEKIKRARIAFQLNKKDNIANALEIIDVTVQKDFATRFIDLFDITTMEHKAEAISKYTTIKVMKTQAIICEILHPESHYNRWTKSCALYESDHETISGSESLVKELSYMDDFLVRETANHVLVKFNKQ